jgi:threonine dehydrogenase-like Zn-dependent dehydrogenase
LLEGLKTALEKAETKADVAVVLGAGTVGFGVDALASVHGAPPGTVSALSAGGALAAKKAWDARRETKRAKKAATKALGKEKQARPRAQKLETFFATQGYEEGVRVIRAHLDWRDEDIIDDEQLDQAVEAARKDFLEWVKKPLHDAPTRPDVPVQRAT